MKTSGFELVEWLAAWQRREMPVLQRVEVLVSGVVEEAGHDLFLDAPERLARLILD